MTVRKVDCFVLYFYGPPKPNRTITAYDLATFNANLSRISITKTSSFCKISNGNPAISEENPKQTFHGWCCSPPPSSFSSVPNVRACVGVCDMGSCMIRTQWHTHFKLNWRYSDYRVFEIWGKKWNNACISNNLTHFVVIFSIVVKWSASIASSIVYTTAIPLE